MEDDAPPPYPPRDVGTIHVVKRITLEVTVPLVVRWERDPRDWQVAIEMVVQSGLYPGITWEQSAPHRYIWKNNTITITLSNIV